MYEETVFKMVLVEDDIMQFDFRDYENLDGLDVKGFLKSAWDAFTSKLYDAYPHWHIYQVNQIDEMHPIYVHHLDLIDDSKDIVASVVATINFDEKSVEAYVRPVSS